MLVRMLALDTSEEADAVQSAVLHRLGAAARLRMALEMSLATRALAESRIQRENPHLDPQAVRMELMRKLYGASIPEAFR